MSKPNDISLINQNSKQILNAKINDLLTIFTNDIHRSLTQAEILFLHRAYDINVISNNYWSKFDFSPMKEGHFRQMVFRLKSLITKCVDSHPPYYKLNRIHFDETLTTKYRGVTPKTIDLDFEKLLLELKQQPPFFHDIRIQTGTNLYECLLKTGLSLNSHNKAFTILVPVDPRFAIKVNVYKTKMLLMVGCSQRPLPYSPIGFGELQFLLGKVILYLTGIVNSEFIYEPIGDWMLTYYHFNRDGRIIDSPIHHYTITDLQNHSLYYLKRFDDGSKRLRYEEHISSLKTINQILQEFK